MIASIFREWISIFTGIFRFTSRMWIIFYLFVGGILPLAVLLSGYLDHSAFEREIIDWKIRSLSNSVQVDPRIIILEIDPKSLSEVVFRFPWPRALYAEALNFLKKDSPRGVLFNILFQHGEENGKPSTGDLQFGEALAGTPNSFLMQILQEANIGGWRQTNLVSPHDIFGNNCTGKGYSNLPIDEDNKVRSISVGYFNTASSSLVFHAAKLLNPEVKLDFNGLFNGREMLLIFAGKGEFRRVSFTNLLREEFKTDVSTYFDDGTSQEITPGFFKDSVVFIGLTAPIQKDYCFTPFGYLPGVVITAHAANSLARGIQVKPLRGGFPLKFLFFILTALWGITFVGNPIKSNDFHLLSLLGGLSAILLSNFVAFRFLFIQFPIVYLLILLIYLYFLQFTLTGIQERLTRESLKMELEIGQNMQKSLLPAQIPNIGGLDIFCRTQPAEEIGGDLYNLFPVGEKKLGVIIGDVAGKGVQAGLFMAMSTILLKHNFLNSSSLKAGVKQISQTLKDHFEGVAPSYLTANFGVVDPLSLKFHMVNAGHEPPIVIFPDSEKVAQISLFGQPLGPVWLTEEIEYSDLSTDIPDGATLIFFTDGFTEAFNSQEEQFGKEQFLELIRRNAKLAPSEMGEILFKEILDFENGAPRSDDRTLIIVRINRQEGKNLNGDLGTLIDRNLDESLFRAKRDSGREGWKEVSISAEIKVLDNALEEILKSAQAFGFSEKDHLEIELLLEEAFANAWKHGSKQSSEKTIRILYRFQGKSFEIFVEDSGEGFDADKLFKEKMEEKDPYKDCGRGLRMLVGYSDKVAYNPKGNLLFLQKQKK